MKKKFGKYASRARWHTSMARSDEEMQSIRNDDLRVIGWAHTDGTFSTVRSGSLSRQLANQLGRPEYYAVTTTMAERLYFVKVVRDFRLRGQ